MATEVKIREGTKTITMPAWGKKITDPEDAVASYVSIVDGEITAEVNIEEDDEPFYNDLTLSSDTAVDIIDTGSVEGHHYTIIPEGGDIRVNTKTTATNIAGGGFLVRDGEAWSEHIKFTTISIIRTTAVSIFVRAYASGTA
jgi:hypothetical protein